MKFFVCILAFLRLAIGQVNPPEMKHIVIPQPNGSRGVALAALSIERGVEFPTVVKLSGNVEIKTPVCIPSPKKGANMLCDGDMVVHADEAEFHEDTGQIEAHGNVTVTPMKHRT
jgi:hypothetical protein